MATDPWDPQKYEQFESQRSRPFYELLALIDARDPELVLDLGCGTGSLTRELHETLRAHHTVGVDSSPAMLAKATEFQADDLAFALGDISDLTQLRTALPAPSSPSGSGSGARQVDLVFSNAALQWIPDHPRVIGRWSDLLGERGELAIQVPSNFDHPSHQIIADLADEEPFCSAGDGPILSDPVKSVLKPEEYSELLRSLGFERQHVRLQVFGHELPSTEAVVGWTSGTTLTRIKRHLPPGLYADFVAEYRRRLLAEIGEGAPYFYAFKRILMWAKRG